MTIYGKLCSQQDRETEVAKAEATEQYRDLGTKTVTKEWGKNMDIMHTHCKCVSRDGA